MPVGRVCKDPKAKAIAPPPNKVLKGSDRLSNLLPLKASSSYPLLKCMRLV